ncbi:MAG TPA: ArsR family transcriptional regulator [Firmicutes bacterium]|nr:ArsR family transcriptional regulator [Bacillota bacterium]
MQLLLAAKAKYKTTREMARHLGISQSTVVRKLKKLGING